MEPCRELGGGTQGVNETPSDSEPLVNNKQDYINDLTDFLVTSVLQISGDFWFITGL